MFKICIFTSERYWRRICKALAKADYHFVISDINGLDISKISNYLSVIIHRRKSASYFIRHIDQLDKISLFNTDQIADNDICIVARQCLTSSFKRLWAAQKELKQCLFSSVITIGSYYCKVQDTYNQIFHYSSKLQKNEKALSIFLIAGGYGDWIRHAYVLQNYLFRKKKMGHEVTIYHANESSYHLSSLFYNIFINKRIPHTFAMRTLKQNMSSTTICLADLEYIASTRLYDISWFLNGKFDLKIDNLVLNSKCSSGRILKRLKKLNQDFQYIIGVQFFTNHIMPNYRNYSPKHAQKFIDLCRTVGIAVINLTRTVGYHLQNVYDFSDCPILALPFVIKKLDCVIGIDSCCAQIAGVMNTPSIVLFNKVYAYSLSVLRNNWNLVSRNGNSDGIDASVVFERLISLLNQQLPLPGSIRPRYRILGETNTEIV